VVVGAAVATPLLLDSDRQERERSRARTSEETEPPSEEAEAERRGVIRGTIRYEDGSPVTGLNVLLDDFWEKPLVDGTFRYERVPAGCRWLYLESVLVETILLRPDQERRLDIRVRRGGRVKGLATAADTGEPIRHRVVSLKGPWETNARLTGDDGAFDLGWVAGGSYDLVVVHYGAYGGTVVPCDVDKDLDVAVAVPRAVPLRVRFDNLLEEWRVDNGWAANARYSLHLDVLFHDSAGRLLSLPYSNRIGWPHGPRSIELDEHGRPVRPFRAPGRGTYSLTLRGRRCENPWLRIPALVPDPSKEIVLRFPDGVPVTVVGDGEVLSALRIGPARVGVSDEGVAYFERTPFGRHVIWHSTRFSEVKVGEIEVVGKEAIEHDLGPLGRARLRGLAATEFLPELRRAADDALVARKLGGGSLFRFVPLHAGAYVLVHGDLRVPVTLAAGQDLDLGLVSAK